MFVLSDGVEVMVLPVADRDKFLAAVHGKRGAAGDEVAGHLCLPVQSSYVCTKGATKPPVLGAARVSRWLARW
jgi:hypothetical protein